MDTAHASMSRARVVGVAVIVTLACRFEGGSPAQPGSAALPDAAGEPPAPMDEAGPGPVAGAVAPVWPCPDPYRRSADGGVMVGDGGPRVDWVSLVRSDWRSEVVGAAFGTEGNL